MNDNIIEEKQVFSEIIGNKKQLILKVTQTSDFVYPNELYKYQIYCKNVSGSTIKNVQIQIYNPSEILIDEDESVPPQGIEIGDLSNSESRLIYIKARCSSIGEFTVHFICFGEESALISKKIQIQCNYDLYNSQTIHRIHIYNFTPYEEKYELLSKDYNSDVTQLIKRQKLPFQAKQNPFKMQSDIDESQNYIDQKEILYDNRPDKINTDEHNYQYLERENFNKEGIETYEGTNLKEIFDDINEKSKLFKAVFLKNGTNALQTDFKQYHPDGFIYRFGLMNSELFHYIGVIPEYSYMSDYLFRWAAEGNAPYNLYPERLDMNWDANKWAGRGWNVWKVYTDEYKEQIIKSNDYKPLFKFIKTFDTLETAKQYIQKEYMFDTTNEFFINTEDGLTKIKKYKYIIKESYFDTGVFFVNIPLNKIPTNFISLTTDEIEAIIEKTKPYGMKALIRYVVNTKFNIDLNTKQYTKLYPNTSFDIENVDYITHAVLPYEYHDIIETICYKNDNDVPIYKERNALKMIPSGNASYNSVRLNLEPNINISDPDPTSFSNLNITPTINNNKYECSNNSNLIYLSQIKNLLYQGNFDDISFYVRNISTSNIPSSEESVKFQTISSVNYNLWKDSLFSVDGEKNVNPHSHWWDISLPENAQTKNTYYFTEVIEESGGDLSSGRVDFIEIPLVNAQLRNKGVESGIGFEDTSGKLHGISAEYYDNSGTFKIKYATSMNNNFKIQKEGLSDIIGLAYNFIHINNNTLVVFFIKKQENNIIKYYYFNHVIVNRIKSVFCFTRNDKDIDSIKKWSNLIQIGKKTDPRVIFNTPQYYNFELYDPNIITESNQWQNLYRIDKNKQSYALIQNSSENEMKVEDIVLHFDQFNIPDDAVIKKISLNGVVESNSYKSIYPSIRIQDGFITKNSRSTLLDLYPSQIECYPYYNNNLAYYENQYNNAKINNVQKSIELFESKINENELFDESLGLSLEYLNNIDDYIIIQKPYWIELSDFSTYAIPLNEVKEINFCIEGYNKGKEVYITTQLKKDDSYSERTEILIPTGYFKKYIPLKFYNKFLLNELQLRFRFIDLNEDLYLFDTYLETKFKRKQKEQLEFGEKKEFEISNKKNIDLELSEDEIPAYLINNGLTLKLEFDNLELGENYKIYDIQLNIHYQKQNINFIINSNSNQIDENNEITIINGITSNNYESGMFFNEVIMPGTYQSKSISNSENQGIELQDALYQSFIATKDNITSITLYPNGFVGNPDINLKIALYENKGNTPNRLLKEIRVNGWSKENENLKKSSIITYDFDINHLEIGEKYWIKLSVDNPIKNNYYLLKYIDSTQNDLKLLTRVNNNYINVFGSLKFHINTMNLSKSFNSLPATEDDQNFSDPKISLSINKRIGEIQRLKIQKK